MLNTGTWGPIVEIPFLNSRRTLPFLQDTKQLKKTAEAPKQVERPATTTIKKAIPAWSRLTTMGETFGFLQTAKLSLFFLVCTLSKPLREGKGPSLSHPTHTKKKKRGKGCEADLTGNPGMAQLVAGGCAGCAYGISARTVPPLLNSGSLAPGTGVNSLWKWFIQDMTKKLHRSVPSNPLPNGSTANQSENN